jgi:hypothetical protein
VLRGHPPSSSGTGASRRSLVPSRRRGRPVQRRRGRPVLPARGRLVGAQGGRPVAAQEQSGYGVVAIQAAAALGTRTGTRLEEQWIQWGIRLGAGVATRWGRQVWPAFGSCCRGLATGGGECPNPGEAATGE